METGVRVCDAMTRKPIAVSPERNMVECARLMQEKGVGSLVVKEGEELKGYITSEVMVQEIIAKNLQPEKVKAGSIMVSNIRTIGPDKDIYDALVLMRDTRQRQVPVVDNGKMVGLLTMKDILKIEPELFEILVDKIRLREEEGKPLFTKPIEGTCDSCGEYFERLYEVNSDFLCRKCRATARVRE